MKQVIIATKNRGKAREFETLFSALDVEILTLVDLDDAPDVEETGNSFEENATLKAEEISKITGQIVIADDSGLVIDELDGRPGIFSARYAGEEKNDEANIDKVLYEMREVPEEKRTARFYCALAVSGPNMKTIVVSGTCEGKILFERKGTNGFGYDPIFYATAAGKSMAEMSSNEKNEISHRAAALNNLKPVIETLF
ncbi:XTP/dITP diphosphatase [Lederbergia wuyishanensis]|uniref:dITP/XTP pyrophosphatase n=1 Tax=Lederbergia wuyishanensis TaxID=1347903 RepID=A0ABU0D1X4_9BACI|nr:XTP/dITP diphosphatase [Lederbergia wuyishanensis]MCJ8007023.1 XTP/dITP diphosphatase [Lederbergia wuyishanensis]MDQ0342407.1 XTP/dITP diphosphohydrolase [Lederbergia wuyishanensis]